MNSGSWWWTGSLACCDSWGHKESDTTEQLNWTELNENYADFSARLETAISLTVIGKETKKQLEKLLAYENANQKCQKAIAPIHETGTITDCLKACCNLGSEAQKMQMLAETMAAAFRKGNEGGVTCGDKNHLKRDCPKKANKKPPRIPPRCHRGMHWAKDCKSKFDIEGKPILGKLQAGDPPGPLQQKPGANSIFSLKHSTSGNATVNIPALDDFFPLPLSSPF